MIKINVLLAGVIALVSLAAHADGREQEEHADCMPNTPYILWALYKTITKNGQQLDLNYQPGTRQTFAVNLDSRDDNPIEKIKLTGTITVEYADDQKVNIRATLKRVQEEALATLLKEDRRRMNVIRKYAGRPTTYGTSEDGNTTCQMGFRLELYGAENAQKVRESITSDCTGSLLMQEFRAMMLSAK